MSCFYFAQKEICMDKCKFKLRVEKVALSQNSKNIILAFASNSEIRGWSVAPVKSAKLVHFTADGQEVVKDISSSIWR